MRNLMLRLVQLCCAAALCSAVVYGMYGVFEQRAINAAARVTQVHMEPDWSGYTVVPTEIDYFEVWMKTAVASSLIVAGSTFVLYSLFKVAQEKHAQLLSR